MRKTSASRGLILRKSALRYPCAIQAMAGSVLLVGLRAVADRPTIVAKGAEDQVLALLVED